MKSIDIVIYISDEGSKNKLFKKIIKETGFRDINHKVLTLETSIDSISELNPRLVISVGEDACKKFDSNYDLNSIAGKIVPYNNQNYRVLFTYDTHDITSEFDYIYSYVFDHFKKIANIYFKNKRKEKKSVIVNQDKVQQTCYSFKLPDWCYDENHVLIDIQNNKYENKVVFIFRDNFGKKKYHYENSNKNYFYIYPDNIKESPIIQNVTDVELHFNRKGLLDDVATYDGDVAIEVKHAIDYYYNRKLPELEWKLKVLFWDIEVYTGAERAFPFPLEAEHPINSISFKLNNDGQTHVYILNCEGIDVKSYFYEGLTYDIDPTDGSHKNIKSKFYDGPINNEIIKEYLYKNDSIKHYNIKLFDTETELISEFLKTVHELDPDIMAGWNTDYFDVPYLVNRMYKLNIDVDKLSPINSADVNINEYFGTTVYGLYFIDQLTLYKKLTQNVEESYKLSTISQKVLGSDKVAYEGTINDMYENDLVKFTLYSGTDTDLLSELEEALNHIQLNFQLIKTCSSTWKRVETTSGMVDPLLLKFAKDRNKVCRNRVHNNKEVFSGAYVLEPRVGLHKWVVDFDFKSLYPSIIRTYNLGPNTYKAKISEEHAELYLYNFDKLPSEIKVIKDPIVSSYEIEIMSPEQLKQFITENNYILSINGCMTVQHEKELSFFYEVLKYLGDMRDIYKNELGECRKEIHENKNLTESEKSSITIKMKQLDNKQMVVKVIANSIYGIVSMPYFRMFNIDIAKAITSTGQEALKYSVYHLSKYMKDDTTKIDIQYLTKFEKDPLDYVAYGDTDSMFILLGDYLIDNDII